MKFIFVENDKTKKKTVIFLDHITSVSDLGGQCEITLTGGNIITTVEDWSVLSKELNSEIKRK